MPTIEGIREVLRTINDPELHRSIVELGMVRGIAIDDGLVTVDLALTIPGCPLKSFFQEVLPAKLRGQFPEIREVVINLGAMTEEERRTLVGGIREESPTPFQRADSSTTVIAVGSGKGGVGKSTVTVNLAAAMAARGQAVGLLDADVWGFSVPRMLGVTSRPTVVDQDLIIPPQAHGFKIISIGNFVQEDNPVIWRGPMLHKALGQFLSNVHWEEPAYLLIDMPPGTGDISLSLSQFVAGAYFIIVTTPQAAAMRVAARAGYAAEKLGLSIGGVIENMAFALCDHCGQRSYPFGQGGGQELADLFQVPLLGQIPLDPPMRELADHGKPSVVAIPSSPSARAFEAVVDEVLARYPPKPRPTAGRKNLPLIMGPNRPKPNGDGHAHHHIHGHGD